MPADALLWREASLATDLDGFLARVGGALLDRLDATSIAVRALDAEHGHLDTLGMIRRGTVGVRKLARPRHALSPAGVARITAWIEAGEHELAGPKGASLVGRDVLRGFADPGEAAWWLVPLIASSEPLGVLVVAGPDRVDSRTGNESLFERAFGEPRSDDFGRNEELNEDETP